jgi:hypothetical protein
MESTHRSLWFALYNIGLRRIFVCRSTDFGLYLVHIKISKKNEQREYIILAYGHMVVASFLSKCCLNLRRAESLI